MELLDPELKQGLGTTILKTGDYQWREDMMPDMMKLIEERVSKWVKDDPPSGYDPENPADVSLWNRRRTLGLHWVRASAGKEFAKRVYKTYARILGSVMEGHGSSTFPRCLENFYKQRWTADRGELKTHLRASLAPLCEPCGCTVDNLVARFSFVTGIFTRAVYEYFGLQVRNKNNFQQNNKYVRVKDREDHAKTYYICGCVHHSLQQAARSKPAESAELFLALDNLKVDMLTAAKEGLPTRHVTLKSRGGLIFASKGYYQLMCKVEDRFYTTV